jgi:hypothetical protein
MSSPDYAWIAGAGAFGKKAGQTLVQRHDPKTILIVDHDETALAEVADTKIMTVQAEATDFLVQNLLNADSPQWIIPCVPFHLAWEWLSRRLGPKAKPLPVPETCLPGLPNPWPTQRGGYTVSYADFICPPDCPEPRDTCTYTGRPRPGLLYEEIERLSVPGYETMVLKSHQMAPGLGGYRSGELLDLEEKALALGGNLIIATACKCHGVLNALAIS